MKMRLIENKFMHLFIIKHRQHINTKISPVTNSTKTRLINYRCSQMLPNPIILEKWDLQVTCGFEPLITSTSQVANTRDHKNCYMLYYYKNSYMCTKFGIHMSFLISYSQIALQIFPIGSYEVLNTIHDKDFKIEHVSSKQEYM